MNAPTSTDWLEAFAADQTGSIHAVNMRHPMAAERMLELIAERRAMFPPRPRYSLADIEAMGSADQLASLEAQLKAVR